MPIKTPLIMTDDAWQKECKRRLEDALGEPELAKKALAALETNPKLRREIPNSLYFRVLTSAVAAC